MLWLKFVFFVYHWLRCQRDLPELGGAAAGPGMSDSPELRQFLADGQLEDYCYINHIAVNYRGSDRPGKGRLSRWLQQLSFLEEFQDGAGQACVRLREARTGGGAAEAPDLAVSPKAPPSAVPPAPPEAAPVRAVAPMAPPDTVPPAPSKAGVKCGAETSSGGGLGVKLSLAGGESSERASAEVARPSPMDVEPSSSANGKLFRRSV